MKIANSIRAFGLAGVFAAGWVGLSGEAAEPGRQAGPSNGVAGIEAAGNGTPRGGTRPTSGVPRIQFETNFFDFGKVTGVETVAGAFKFKNTGDGILKLEPPQASCDCTEPRVKPEALGPGETGEILYTIRLDRPLNGQRLIRVRSNDPKTPEVQLTVQLDYTPLYQLSPILLWMDLPAGMNETQRNLTISRNDGKPLGIERLTTSKEWIKAAFDSSFKPQESSAQVNVIVRRPPGPPAPFNGAVQMWTSNQTVLPVQTVPVMGEVFGELSAVPAKMYWVIPDFGKDKAAYPAEALTRKIELKSVLGKPVEIKRVSSDIKGLSVQVVTKEAGRAFDIVIKFDELPREFTNGNVTVETSLASLPRLEVPLTIAVAEQ
jgi:hypothetical protein